MTTTADSIRADLDRKLASIRNRRDLTDHAKQVAVARAYEDAQTRMEQARQADTERFQRDRQRLERQLFGAPDSIGSDAMSQRQAREMASQIGDPQAAADAYRRAVRDGDKAYARAIASHAADMATIPLLGLAWKGVVEMYAQDSPARAEALAQLDQLREPGMGTDFTYVLPTPSEMGRLSPGQVLALAGDDLEVHGDAPSAA
ncbi:hypothetical protein ACH4UY_33395 [Streptomyces longwoodensis]|uniref:hypothetical protein n=1 Tax=Streptomyces longwoodensis TaxID=68231 RepID=UPI003787309E